MDLNDDVSDNQFYTVKESQMDQESLSPRSQINHPHEERKMPNISKTRDFDNGGSDENIGSYSNFDQGSLDEDGYGGLEEVIGN